MTCNKCGSTNVIISESVTYEPKKKGCLWQILFFPVKLLMLFAFGIFYVFAWLVAKITRKPKVKPKFSKRAVCQSCGNSWTL